MIKLNSSNVTIMVNDMDTAIKFYENLGLTLKQRWGNNYAMIEGPGITLGIHPSEKSENTSGTVSIGFMVDDIKEANILLEANGINATQQDDGKSGTYLHFKDPDGTILYFVKPKW